MQKFKPHKHCSCEQCRRGKTRYATLILERKLRHDCKRKLRSNPSEYENECTKGNYFD